MRVEDIMGNQRNVKLEQISMNYESARGLTFWKNNLRLVLTEDQKELVKQHNNEVEFFDGYRTKTKTLDEIFS